LDLIFPHHENEIAQSNGAGYPFAQRWLHNAWVTTAGEKMSKSLGNTLRIHELLKRVRGIELRWYLGSAHYRSMLEYSPEALDESAVNFRRIESFLKRAAAQLGKVPERAIADDFAKAMDDDLAVPAALAVISNGKRREREKISRALIGSEIPSPRWVLLSRTLQKGHGGVNNGCKEETRLRWQ